MAVTIFTNREIKAHLESQRVLTKLNDEGRIWDDGCENIAEKRKDHP